MSTPVGVRALLETTSLQALARPSDLRYGRAIHGRGGIVFIERTETHVEAWVGGLPGAVAEGGSQRRRAHLEATPDGLRWSCTGNPIARQIFCKHCAALALAILTDEREDD